MSRRLASRRRSRQRRQIDYEGERRLEVVQEPDVGSDQLARLPLGEGDVEAVIDADPGAGCNRESPGQERIALYKRLLMS